MPNYPSRQTINQVAGSGIKAGQNKLWFVLYDGVKALFLFAGHLIRTFLGK